MSSARVVLITMPYDQVDILEDFLDREEGMASLRARYEREQEARQAADG